MAWHMQTGMVVFKMKQDDTLIISNCLVELKSQPQQLAEFVTDLEKGKYKHWEVFKREKGRLAELHFLGRPTPERTSKGPKRHEQFRFASRLNSFHCLPLHKCRTEKERVKMILNSGASNDILMDLLSVHAPSLKGLIAGFNSVLTQEAK
jgi:hypothetical protein